MLCYAKVFFFKTYSFLSVKIFNFKQPIDKYTFYMYVRALGDMSP